MPDFNTHYSTYGILLLIQWGNSLVKLTEIFNWFILLSGCLFIVYQVQQLS